MPYQLVLLSPAHVHDTVAAMLAPSSLPILRPRATVDGFVHMGCVLVDPRPHASPPSDSLTRSTCSPALGHILSSPLTVLGTRSLQDVYPVGRWNECRSIETSTIFME